MRVLVCGGRDFTDAKLLHNVLDAIHAKTPITCVIHGNAWGADTLAGSWAALNKVALDIFVADWNKHRKSAGTMRNQLMLTVGKPDLVIAFPGGKGTADMVQRAKRANVVVQIEGAKQ